MTKKSKVVAFIPVRGGSKSIPLKNIKQINGRPLVYWTIDAAIGCSYIDEVYISTDSSDIKNTVENYDKQHYGKLKCIGRSDATATDSASTESVLLEFSEKISCNEIVLIQATSPLLTAVDLNLAFEKFYQYDYDSLLSLVRQKRFVWREEDQGFVYPQNYDFKCRPRRQEFDGFLVENGAFYITKHSLLLSSKVRISGKIGYYEMDEESYVEIDEISDWFIVEELMKKKGRLNLQSKKLAQIKLFATDCDGVLTDGGMYFSADGDVAKKFNTKDGQGFANLKKMNIPVAIITGENSPIVKKRAEKLKIDDLFLGCKNKISAMEQLLIKYNLSYNQVAYIGDDINDLPLMEKVGYAFAVADAVSIVKENADSITSLKGGKGAVREAIDLIVAAKMRRKHS